jgi:hypothetical protein
MYMFPPTHLSPIFCTLSGSVRYGFPILSLPPSGAIDIYDYIPLVSACRRLPLQDRRFYSNHPSHFHVEAIFLKVVHMFLVKNRQLFSNKEVYSSVSGRVCL